MRTELALVFLIHGLIHLLGFAKAFDFANMAQFTKEISKPAGLLWLLAGQLFIVTGVLYFMKKEFWPILAIVTVVLSQILIFIFWKGAKLDTIANVILLMVAIIGFGKERFENGYKKDVVSAMATTTLFDELITKKDLSHLPLPVTVQLGASIDSGSLILRSVEGIQFPISFMRFKNTVPFSFAELITNIIE